MAFTSDLSDEGFTANEVEAKTVNIDHPDPSGLGPFCRLIVTTTVEAAPGVYAWVTDEDVMYVGMAGELLQIVNGTRMGRPYNDYTYMPASKVGQASSPRVRVNGLLNSSITSGQKVTWWSKATDTIGAARQLEAILIDRWQPPWNRTRPPLGGRSHVARNSGRCDA
jgi:hypothetical protein